MLAIRNLLVSGNTGTQSRPQVHTSALMARKLKWGSLINLDSTLFLLCINKHIHIIYMCIYIYIPWLYVYVYIYISEHKQNQKWQHDKITKCCCSYYCALQTTITSAILLKIRLVTMIVGAAVVRGCRVWVSGVTRYKCLDESAPIRRNSYKVSCNLAFPRTAYMVPRGSLMGVSEN